MKTSKKSRSTRPQSTTTPEMSDTLPVPVVRPPENYSVIGKKGKDLIKAAFSHAFPQVASIREAWKPGANLSAGTLAPSPIGIPLVWCPQGTYMMGGADDNSHSYADEKPQHPITFNEGFWVLQHPFTREARDLVNGAKSDGSGGDMPADDLNLWDAMELANRASIYAKEHGGEDYADFQPLYNIMKRPDRTYQVVEEIKGRIGFALPTEEQYEYFCRAGTTTPFYWGEEVSGAENHAWYRENSDSQVQPVARLQPNNWGIYDTVGNTYSWTCSTEQPNKYLNRVKSRQIIATLEAGNRPEDTPWIPDHVVSDISIPWVQRYFWCSETAHPSENLFSYATFERGYESEVTEEDEDTVALLSHALANLYTSRAEDSSSASYRAAMELVASVIAGVKDEAVVAQAAKRATQHMQVSESPFTHCVSLSRLGQAESSNPDAFEKGDGWAHRGEALLYNMIWQRGLLLTEQRGIWDEENLSILRKIQQDMLRFHLNAYPHSSEHYTSRKSQYDEWLLRIDTENFPMDCRSGIIEGASVLLDTAHVGLAVDSVPDCSALFDNPLFCKDQKDDCKMMALALYTVVMTYFQLDGQITG